MPTPAALRRLSKSSEHLLAEVLDGTLECVYDPSFRRGNAERNLLEPLPDESEDTRNVAQNDDSGMDLLAPRRHRVLSQDEERALFLRFNYCRYRIMLIVRKHADKRLGLTASREILRWLREALLTRNAIVRLNTSLVMAMARRTRTMGVELGDLISEGNLALLRCVDKFDCTRGFKFSTYACRAIMSSFARLGAKTARYRNQFPAPYDPSLERSDDLETKRLEDSQDCVTGLQSILAENTADLSSVERRVINARFSLEDGEPEEGRRRAPTLEQVGALLGVSKERVRQIQNRALEKLRTQLEETVFQS
jgi:RNA polymerase sigma factor (sigma-70 family)